MDHAAIDAENYLIVDLASQLYAMPYARLVQIIDSPRATRLPNAGGHVRGTIDFLGETVLLYDLRKCLGMPSMDEELAGIADSLAARKQDHVAWLDRLKDEIRGQREITVQTDPHKCLFGRWYDQFKPENLSLARFLARFDGPHRHIHRLAAEAKGLMSSGRGPEAQALVREAEHREFTQLLGLFDEAGATIRSLTHEYAVVLEQRENKVALSVDLVRAFDRFDDISHDVPRMLRSNGGDIVQAIGRRVHRSRTEEVLILDIERVLTID